MRKFHIWHLLLVTTVAAMVFAVGRLLDYASVLMVFAFLAVVAPLISYGIAAMTAAKKRATRQTIRRSLLAGTLGVFATTDYFINGFDFFLPMLVLLFVFWIPQLILLQACSAYRSALVGTQFSAADQKALELPNVES